MQGSGNQHTIVTSQLSPHSRVGQMQLKSLKVRMASLKRKGVRPNKVKRQWRLPRPNEFAMGEPDEANSSVDYLPGGRTGYGRLALGFQTMQDCIAQKGELGSCKRNRAAKRCRYLQRVL